MAHPGTVRRRSAGRITGALTGVAGLIAGLALTVTLPTAAFAAPAYEDVCLDNGNPLIYVGGDFATSDFNEVGSPFVINGDATFNGGGGPRNGVGHAPGGDRVPTPGEIALRVGGTFTGQADVRGGPGSEVDIKARIASKQSGAVITTADDVQWDLGHGAALGRFVSWAADGAVQVAANSYLDAGATAGTVSAGLTLTGTNAARQTFTVPASEFNGTASSLYFKNMQDTELIVINVTGSNPNLNFSYVELSDGSRGDDGAGLVKLAKQLVWVFDDATAVTFSGSSQFVGSVLAPKADVTIDMTGGGMNGRLWVGNNLTFGANVGGWEIHDFQVTADVCPNGSSTSGPGTDPECEKGTHYENGACVPDKPGDNEEPNNGDNPDGSEDPKPGKTVTPSDPDVQQALCTVDKKITKPSVTLPKNTDDVHYSLDGEVKPGKTVRVWAKAQGDAEFPTSVAGWERAEDGSLYRDVTLRVVETCADLEVPTVDEHGVITLPENECVDYSTDETADDDIVLVLAEAKDLCGLTPQEGWDLNADGTEATYTLDVQAAQADAVQKANVLAATGVKTSELVGFAALLLGAGVLMQFASRRRVSVGRHRA